MRKEKREDDCAHDEEIEYARVPAAVRIPLRKPLARRRAGRPDVFAHPHGLNRASEGRGLVKADRVQHLAGHHTRLYEYEGRVREAVE